MLRFSDISSVIRQRFYWIGLILLASLILLQLLPWRTNSSLSNNQTLAANLTGDICIVAPVTPFDPAWGIGLLAPRAIPIDARCPVCGMFPARSRDWAAQLIFKDGDTHFFDSPLSLFLYLQDVTQYSSGRSSGEIAVSYVNAANTNSWIKADEATYVSGSNVLGPMRAGNLPAFSSVAAAQDFATKRGGTLLTSKQITPQLLQALNGTRRHNHNEATHVN